MDLTLGNDGSMDKVCVLLLVLLDQALCNFQAGHIFLGWLGLGIHGLVIYGSLRLWMVPVSSSLKWLITPLSCPYLVWNFHSNGIGILLLAYLFQVFFAIFLWIFSAVLLIFLDFCLWFLIPVLFCLIWFIYPFPLWFFSNSVYLFYFYSSCIFLASVIPIYIVNRVIIILMLLPFEKLVLPLLKPSFSYIFNWDCFPVIVSIWVSKFLPHSNIISGFPSYLCALCSF